MNTLSTHIQYLLLRRDCVVVPGLGAFINVRHSAAFDAELGMWLPMTREVRFNRALTHDDGLLANSYARRSQVSFEDGRDMLRDDIARLQRMLRDEGEVRLGQLGSLRLDEETLRFIPCHTASQLSEMTGHAPAPIARRKTAQVEKEAQASSATEPSRKEAVVATESLRFDTKRNYYIPVNKIFAKVAACVAAIVFVGVSAMIPISDCNRADQASVVPVEKIIKATARQIAAPDTAKAAVETPPAAEMPEQAEEPSASEMRYHAIVATFNTPGEAEEYAAQHSGAGIKLSVISTRTRSRVSAASANDREEVRRAMAGAEFQKNFSEAWIWEKE